MVYKVILGEDNRVKISIEKSNVFLFFTFLFFLFLFYF